ncbi:MAG: type II toxin-antitoxin system HicB family antitoxin [Oceanospirillaceae bacterium]|nr:type II toxin-antitoxin system HicB family antitoxin [Oceanospirillaceae bacterium]
MSNLMDFSGNKAIISYDSEIEMFRGEFTNLNGGADSYAANVDDLRIEGATSLKVFLDMCKADGVEPKKSFSGKFNLRISPRLHEELALAAAVESTSINQWVIDTLPQSVRPAQPL